MLSSKLLGNVGEAALPPAVDSQRGIPKVSSVTRNRAIFTEGELDFGQMDIWEDDGNVTPLDSNTRQMRFSFAASNIDALFRSPRNSQHISFKGETLEILPKPLQDDVSNSHETYESPRGRKATSQEPILQVPASHTVEKSDNTGSASEWTSTPVYNQQFKRLVDFFETGHFNESSDEFTASKPAHNPDSEDDIHQPQSIDFFSAQSSLITIPSAFRETNSSAEHVEMFEPGNSNLTKQPHHPGSLSDGHGNEWLEVDHVRTENSRVEQQQISKGKTITSSLHHQPARKKHTQERAFTHSAKRAMAADVQIEKGEVLTRLSSGSSSDIQPISMISPTRTDSDWGTAFIDTKVKKQQPIDKLEDAGSPITKSLKNRFYSSGFDILKKLRSSPRLSLQKKEDKATSKEPFLTKQETQPSSGDRKSILSRFRLTEMLNGKGKGAAQTDANRNEDGEPRNSFKARSFPLKSNGTLYGKILPTLAKVGAERLGNPERVAVEPESGKVDKGDQSKEEVGERRKSRQLREDYGAEGSSPIHPQSHRVAGKQLKSMDKEHAEGKPSRVVADGTIGKTVRRMFSPRNAEVERNTTDNGGQKTEAKSDSKHRIFICTETGPCLIGEPSPWAPEHVRNAPLDASMARRAESVANLGGTNHNIKAETGLHNGGNISRNMTEERSALARVINARKREAEARECRAGKRDTGSDGVESKSEGAKSRMWCHGVARSGMVRLFSPRSVGQVKEGVCDGQGELRKVQAESILGNASGVCGDVEGMDGAVRGDDLLEDVEADAARHVGVGEGGRSGGRKSGSGECGRRDWWWRKRVAQGSVESAY